ncbi:MAG: bifunctional demethylmenaquinone methyltransferase/2-methoxy-6-polyprenyl-1,4-benzoquinol methylase UbiE [Pseudomonadota bacterium]
MSAEDEDPAEEGGRAQRAGRADEAGAAGGRTHFGYQDVDVEDKPALVRGVFDAVASRYDLMNDLMSAGVHRLWKEAMIDWLAPRRGARMLDLAGGTGDIAQRALRRAKGDLDVTVADLTEAMLVEGRKRFAKDGTAASVAWVCADATEMPFPDRSFDYATISFGLRNVAEPDKALREIRRVLKPGGRFLCLEFSHVKEPGLAPLYEAYSFNVIPLIGQVVAGERESYQYLVESIRRFPDQETLEAMMREAGFGQVSHRNLTFGVAALHSGWRL